MKYLMNGLTLQLAGEALFCREEEEKGLYDYRATYLTCLEDFVFAALFGDNILVTGNMPMRGGQSPGQTLKEKNSDFVASASSPNSVTPDSLLDDDQSRKLILQKIDVFCRRFDLESERYFVDWITREALSDLGNDDSLYDYEISSDKIVFQKSPGPMIDTRLQEAVHERVVDRLQRHLTITFQSNAKHPTGRAFREFITRNIVTHIVIDVWYDLIFRQQKQTKFLPYITRRYLIDQNYQRMKNLIVPYAIAAVVKHITKKEDFISVLSQVRDWSICEKIRELLNDYYFDTKEGQERTLKSLAEAVFAASRPMSDWQTPLDGNREAWRLRFLPEKQILTDLTDEAKKVRESLSTIFPYLVANQPAYLAGPKPVITTVTTTYGDVIGDKGTKNVYRWLDNK